MRRELKCVKNIYEEEKITHVALTETFATIGLPGFGLRCVCVGIAKFFTKRSGTFAGIGTSLSENFSMSQCSADF